MLVVFLLSFFLVAAEPPPAQEDAPAERIGRDMCFACHEVEDAFTSSVHGGSECEDCHGPGSLHMDSGGDPDLIAGPSYTGWTESCLECHATGERELAGFHQSPHGVSQVGCQDCHQVHPEEGNFGLLRVHDSVNLCVDCHQSTEAAFRKPFHHPVLEGGMTCTDCHNPHSDPERSSRRLEMTPSYGCASCHADKKGPFVFLHAPVEAANCQSCHQPHGSFNSKLLVRTEVHQLCLECHTMTPDVAGAQPPSFHNLRSPRFRNCTVCHRTIHGSNVNPLFLR